MTKTHNGRAVDMTGCRTKHARVIGRVANSKRTHWALECVCGNVFRAEGSDIRRRPNMSCGCRGITVPTLKKTLTPGLCHCCPSKAIRYRGLCLRCYSRARSAGVLEEVAADPQPNGFVGVTGANHPRFGGTRSDGVRGYDLIHKRLSRTRGSASRYDCAAGCGRPAAHWSYDGYCPDERLGNEDGTAQPYCEHMHHYQPRCRRCHSEWDRDAAYVAAR
jgi:hypothetical protein